MADSNNAIDIVVQNSVDPAIAPRLITIAEASDSAAKSLGTLKAQLKDINSSGLGGLLSQLTALSRSEGDLTSQIGSSTTAIRAQTTSIAQARVERDKLRAENAGLALSEAVTQARWEKSILVSERAAAAQTALSEARSRDADLQAFASEIADALTVQLELQAKATTTLTAALDDEIAIQEAVNAGVAEFESLLAAAVEDQVAYSAGIAQIAAAHELAQAAIAETTVQEAVWGSTLAETSAQLEAQGLAVAAANDAIASSTIAAIATGEEFSLVMNAEEQSVARLAATLDLTGLKMGKLSASTAVATEATVGNAVAQSEQAGAATASVSANVSAAAAMGILEGRTLSMNRAAANFITKILGLGPILQQAFVVIGAVALVAVLYQAYEALTKFLNKANNAGHVLGEAFDGIIEPLRKANDSLAVTNDKLDQTLAKLEHKPTSNGAALALDEARQAADRLDTELQKVSNDLDKILNKNRIGAVASILTDKGATGDTESFIRTQFDNIDKIRSQATSALDAATANKDPKAAQAATAAAYAAERDAIQKTINALNEQWNAKKKVQDLYDKKQESGLSAGDRLFSSGLVGDQTANLTILGKSVQLAQQDLRGLDETMANIDKNHAVDALRDRTSEMRNETKAAAAQWKQLEAAYISFQSKITASGHKPTPQQDLGFLQSKESGINPLNADKLQAKEQPLKNKIAGEQYGENEIAKLQAQADNMAKYGTALKEATEDDRIFQEAAQKGLPLTDQQIAKITSLVGYINQHKALQTEETKIQKEAASVETQYGLALTASAIVMRDHPELVAGITREVNKMKIAHDEALDPMLEVNRALADQRALDGQYGQQLEVSAAVQALANKLRKDGVTDWQQQAEAQRGALTTQNELNTAQANNKALYDETTGALEKLTDRKDALNKATETELSNEAKSSALTQNAIEQGNQRLTTGQSTSQKDIIGGVAGDLIKNYTTIAAGIKDTFAGVFKTLSDGFADSIGRAIVYSKNLGQALKDVARSAISELISGLIKLGIQYLVLVGLKKLLGIGKDDDKSAAATGKQIAQQALLTAASLAAMATVTAAGLASATALGAAWWPVAEAASLASFGSNAIPAATGISTVVALGTLSSVPKLDVGTNYVQRSGLAMIHEGEAVVPKQYNPAAGGSQQSQSRGSNNAPQMKVTVEDHTTGAKIQVIQTSDDHIRILARDVATQAVHAHTDSAVANAVSQPNSKTSKALRVNTGTRRTR